jgi:protein AFG1
LNRLFKVFAERENDRIRQRVLSVNGRDMQLQRTCGRVADCEFDELCDRPLGAADYIAIAQLFHTLIIRNIPRMTEKHKTQARRFITLIDTLYEQRVRVLFSAEVPFRILFQSDKDKDSAPDDEDRKLMDDLGIQLNSVSLQLSVTDAYF